MLAPGACSSGALITLNGVCPRPVPAGLDQPQGLVYSPLNAACPTANTRSWPPATSAQACLKLPVTSPPRSERWRASCTASVMLVSSAAYSLIGTEVGSEWPCRTTLTSSCGWARGCPSAVATTGRLWRPGGGADPAVTVSVTVSCWPDCTGTLP